MIDFSSINPLALLATGGLMATVIAGWNHVKHWFSYVASFAIVKTDISDQTLSRELFNHFRRAFYVVPSTQHNYTTFYLEVGKKNNYQLIPFKWPTGPTIFIKFPEMYVVTAGYSSITVYSLRGLNRVEDHLKAVSKTYIDTQSTKKRNDYRVIDVMGTEKIGSESFSNYRKKENVARPDESNPLGSVSEKTNYERLYDNELDTPLIFADQIQQQVDACDPFEGLFYDAHVWKVVDDIDAWFNMREWYAERSISWRRGICLHGPGGTGKSALITAIAKHLGLRLYRYYLSTLSDQEFVSEWSNMVTPCVVAFEDFDTVFNGRTPLTEHKALTFDCILNEISGVKTKDGVLLVVTTNHLDHIDPAMGVVSSLGDISTRPGRIDVTCFLGTISQENKVKMANRILAGYPDLIKDVLSTTENVTPIQFQEMCTQKAYSIMGKLLPRQKS